VASRIAGVKLHHSLNHALCHPESPKYRRGHPAGHPKLPQLDAPLTLNSTSRTTSL